MDDETGEEVATTEEEPSEFDNQVNKMIIGGIFLVLLICVPMFVVIWLAP